MPWVRGGLPRMITLGLEFLVVFGLLAVVTAAAVRHPSLVALGAGLIVSLSWEYPILPSIATVQGLNVYTSDILAIVAVSSTLLRSARTRPPFPPVIQIAFGTFVATIVWSLLRGLLAYGPTGSVNESRPIVYLIALAFWSAMFVSSSDDNADALVRWIYRLAWVLSAIATYHLVRYGLGSADSFVNLGPGGEQTGRPLVASQALAVAAGALVAVAKGFKAGRKHYYAGATAFLVVVILVQQRTVWVAAAAAFAVVGLLGTPQVRRAMAVVLAGFVVASAAVVQFSSSSFISAINNSLTSSGTYNARTNDRTYFTDLLQHSDLSVQLLGFPFGSGWLRAEGNLLISFGPHNWYLAIAMRLGVVGLSSAGVFAFCVFKRAAAHRLTLIAGLVALLAVYSWAYTLPSEAGILAGYCVALASAADRRDAEKSTVGRPISGAAAAAGGGPRPTSGKSS